MDDPLFAHNAAAQEYDDALDAFVQVTTTADVITRVVDFAKNGDMDSFMAWVGILEDKVTKLRDVSGLLKEYYSKAYQQQFNIKKKEIPSVILVSEAFKKSK
jgi:hypothetical protein